MTGEHCSMYIVALGPLTVAFPNFSDYLFVVKSGAVSESKFPALELSFPFIHFPQTHYSARTMPTQRVTGFAFSIRTLRFSVFRAFRKPIRCCKFNHNSAELPIAFVGISAVSTVVLIDWCTTH